MKKEILMLGNSEHKWYNTGRNGWWSIPIIVRQPDDPEGYNDDIFDNIELNISIDGDDIPTLNDLQKLIKYPNYNKLTKNYKIDFSEKEYKEKITELVEEADRLLSLYRQ